MLDHNLKLIISGMISVERSRQSTKAREAAVMVRDDWTRKGALGHGRFPIEIERVCAAELEYRGKEWLTISRRAFADSSTRWTPTNAAILRELLEAELRVDWDGLLDLYRDSVRPNDGSRRFGALDEAKGHIDAELANEIQLLVLSEDRSRVPVSEQLMSPRYTDVLHSWRRATGNSRMSGDQRVQSIRDAVGAVEQLARIVTRSPAATLGQCVANLRRESLNAPLLRGVEELWAWTSNAPGLRHGASAAEQPTSAETEYCLKLSEASLLLLLSRDTLDSV